MRERARLTGGLLLLISSPPLMVMVFNAVRRKQQVIEVMRFYGIRPGPDGYFGMNADMGYVIYRLDALENVLFAMCITISATLAIVGTALIVRKPQ